MSQEMTAGEVLARQAANKDRPEFIDANKAINDFQRQAYEPLIARVRQIYRSMLNKEKWAKKASQRSPKAL